MHDTDGDEATGSTADAATGTSAGAGAEPEPDAGASGDGAFAEGTVDDGKLLEFGDAVELQTTKDELWSVISDPAALTELVPGAEEIDRVSKRQYTLEITRGVSHLTVSLSGEVEFVEMNEPDWIVTSGFAHDTKTGSDFDILAAMEMTETGDETTELAYTAEVSFTGGVASLGTGLLRPIVRRDVDTYFENVRAVVEDGERS